MGNALFSIYFAVCIAGGMMFCSPHGDLLLGAMAGVLVTGLLPGMVINFFFNHLFVIYDGVVYGGSLLFWVVVVQLAKLRRPRRSAIARPPTPAMPQATGYIRKKTYYLEED